MILLGRTVLSNEDDSSSLGGDQIGVLSRRRKAGESRCAENVAGRRRSLPESGGCRYRSMVR